MISAIPHVFNVAVVCLIFYLIFGLFLVSLKKGELYFCYELNLDVKGIFIENIITKFDCLNHGGDWINRNLNYDNILNAMYLLYSVSLVDWIYQSFIVIDSVGVDY
mmetsp:Transcript_6088/g.5492  ORF Transcript_6088/g.5492 Transcript_6088/m.5492 type:complete len:106 (+) Transcript_6088:127-444(+)